MMDTMSPKLGCGFHEREGPELSALRNTHPFPFPATEGFFRKDGVEKE